MCPCTNRVFLLLFEGQDCFPPLRARASFSSWTKPVAECEAFAQWHVIQAKLFFVSAISPSHAQKRVIFYPTSPPMDRIWCLPPLPIHNWAGEEAEAAAQRVQREDTEERELSTEGPWRPPRRHQVPFWWTGHQNWTSLSRHNTAPESSPFQLK